MSRNENSEDIPKYADDVQYVLDDIINELNKNGSATIMKNSFAHRVAVRYHYKIEPNSNELFVNVVRYVSN